MPRFLPDPTLLAFERMADGNLDGAEALLRDILVHQPDQPDALHGLACIARARGENARAIGYAGKAIRQSGSIPASRTARMHITLGLALLDEKHPEPARAALHVAILLQPGDPRAHAGLAAALEALDRLDEALEALREAIRLAAADVALLAKFGEIAFRLRRWPDAISAYEALAGRFPKDSGVLANLGASLFEAGRISEACVVLAEAVQCGNATPETLNNLGLAQMAQGDLEAADTTFHAAVRAAPHDARIAGNQGTLLNEMGETASAETIFSRIFAAQPQTPEGQRARFNLATIKLARGDFATGWQDFEARHEVRSTLPVVTKIWDGSCGDTPIAVTMEQGLGDMIQFLRYLPDAAARRPLRLRFPQAEGLVARMPHLDMQRILPAEGDVEAEISLLSLPLALGQVGEPKITPYLASTTLVEPDLVGLAWAGNPGYRSDLRRSVPLELLEPLSGTPGLRFLSLQKDVVPAWMEAPGELSTLTDLVDAVGRCALVISVDSLVAHVAGAVGRPLWLLNRYGGDWRWKDIRWYRDVRQFRPAGPGLPAKTWPPVIDAVARALRQTL